MKNRKNSGPFAGILTIYFATTFPKNILLFITRHYVSRSLFFVFEKFLPFLFEEVSNFVSKRG